MIKHNIRFGNKKKNLGCFLKQFSKKYIIKENTFN